ncbi:MAG TPA: glycosyltransferase, partial [Candidatus Marinimicrobia bacterium]|nr:glycosyltransferase [Candidatus Neomarinimicrobiota bacterium]
MKSPKVTVLMSVYNDERYLSESVDSILNQTYKDFEFLIINDGSTDRSREILESYSDPRIRLVRNDGNIGLTRSLNKGLALAMGEYIARMDADDISLPERLEKQVGFLDADSSVGVLGINSLLIDEDGNVLEKLQRPVTHDSIMAEMLTENRFVHSSVMLRKKLLKMSGYYDEKLDMAQDYELFLRLSLITKLSNLAEPLHMWRKDRTGISFAMRSAQIVARDRIRTDYLNKLFSIDKGFIDLVVANAMNDPRDAILSTILIKILKKAPSSSVNIAVKLKIYYCLMKYFYPLSICTFIKDKIACLIKRPEQGQKALSKHIKRDHPDSLIFLMKNTCNARCVMCGLSYADNKDMAEISLSDYRTMLDNLVMHKAKEIIFSGGGDPLLCKDLISIIGYTSQSYPKINLFLYTNGIALNEDISRELIENQFSRIVLSINASTAEVHRKIMRVSSFNKVVENTSKLIELRNNARAKTRIQLSFIASRLNIEDLPGLVNLGADLGADEVSMQYCRFYSKKMRVNSIECNDAMDKTHSLFFHQEHSDE